MSETRDSAGLPRRTRLRLWLSYQRYAFLLLAGAGAALALPALVAPTAWWLWGLVAIAAFPVARFGVVVFRRWPEKLAATLRQQEHIAGGSFDPDRLEHWCGDPCSRVVASEVLTQAGRDRTERRAQLRRLTEEYRRHGEGLVLVDHTNGVVYTHHQGTTEKALMPPQQGGIDG